MLKQVLQWWVSRGKDAGYVEMEEYGRGERRRTKIKEVRTESMGEKMEGSKWELGVLCSRTRV